jgi:hypothetical protein
MFDRYLRDGWAWWRMPPTGMISDAGQVRCGKLPGLAAALSLSKRCRTIEGCLSRRWRNLLENSHVKKTSHSY